MSDTFQKILLQEEETLSFGAKLALACKKNAIIFLYGDLGSGKTTLTRGFMRELGYQGHVKSPTYTIVEPYQLTQHLIYHFDLYRIKDPEELNFIGIQDYFIDDAICLIEWPDQGKGVLPQADLSCYIEIQGNHRVVNTLAYTPEGHIILEKLRND